MQERRAQGPHLEIADPIKAVWKRKWLILAGGLVCAILTFIGCLFLPKRYEALATVLVRPPRVPDDIKLPLPPPDFFYSLANSDPVRRRFQAELQPKGLWGSGEWPGKSLRSELTPAKDKSPQAKALVRLIAQAETPSQAAVMANAWADAFISEGTRLASEERENMLAQLRKNYSALQTRIAALEAERFAKEDALAQELLKKRRAWDTKILQERKVFERWHHAYSVETEKQRLAFEQRWRLDTLLEELREKEARWTQLDGRKEVEEGAPALSSGGAETGPAAKKGATLRSDIENQRRTLFEKSAELYEQQKNRELTQSLRTEEQRTQVAALEQARDSELDGLLRRNRRAVESITRDLDRLRSQFSTQATRYEAAGFLQPEDLAEITLGARAVAPLRPVGPRVGVYTLIAFGLGLTVSLMLTLVPATMGRI